MHWNTPVETQLYRVSSRYYSPELCRFISPDDVEYLDPESVNGLNLYCYCYNDPINYYDPSGHLPEWLECLLITVIAAFAAADIQSVITDGESNYLSFLGGSYDDVKSALYFTSYMFGYVGQFAQPGWGRQTSGTSDASIKGHQYGQYTKITQQGNDVTLYNGRGQAILRYDYSHSHGGIQPHVHQFDWWKYNGKWCWNGRKGNVYPF